MRVHTLSVRPFRLLYACALTVVGGLWVRWPAVVLLALAFIDVEVPA